MAWHVGVRSFKCELMQALMRPAPGCTPPHCALTSAAHSFGTAAIVLVVESNTMAPIAKIFLSISLSPRFLHSQIELGRDGLQRCPLHALNLPKSFARAKYPRSPECPLLALSGHAARDHGMSAFGVKQTCPAHQGMSANDPKRTSSEVGFSPYQNANLIGYNAMSKAWRTSWPQQ